MRHHNWTLPWIGLIPLHLPFVLGFSAWLVLFLIILTFSLLPALDLVNCGARLGLFLHLCLWLQRCWHLNLFIIFLATWQPLDSDPLLHPITSPWLRPTEKLTSLFQIFRLVLVLLPMPLLTQSNSSLTWELSWLKLFPLYPILREVLFLCLKCMICFSRFMVFWTMLFPNKLGTQLTF